MQRVLVGVEDEAEVEHEGVAFVAVAADTDGAADDLVARPVDADDASLKFRFSDDVTVNSVKLFPAGVEFKEEDMFSKEFLL